MESMCRVKAGAGGTSSYNLGTLLKTVVISVRCCCCSVKLISNGDSFLSGTRVLLCRRCPLRTSSMPGRSWCRPSLR